MGACMYTIFYGLQLLDSLFYIRIVHRDLHLKIFWTAKVDKTVLNRLKMPISL